MSNNLLASYFTNSSDLSGSTDAAGGRSFFDIISECKDFNDRDSNVLRDEDSVYDIWPMSEKLLNASKSPVDLINSTEFSFAIQEALTDPIKQLVLKHFGSQEAAKRQLPNADSVVCDVNGLQILIKCGCYRSVVNLTQKILKNLVIKHSSESKANKKPIFTPYSLQLWFIRIAVLMKLKLFKEAEQELKQFENFEKPELFYESQVHFYPDRKGSMVPFGLRMLNAELPQYLNKPEEATANLYKLLKIVNSTIDDLLPNKNESSLKIWYERKIKVLFSIVNILISRKNLEKAIEFLLQIVDVPHSDKCMVWSTIGKLFVQVGDLKDASDCFYKAQTFSDQDSTKDKSRNLLNLSLLKIANNQYKEAYEILKQANALNIDNPIITNNMAFCLFYSGNLSEAINLIETHINRNNQSKNMLNESVIFNLCTLYELESAKALNKKLNLLLALNIYAGDGFYTECLQLL